MATPNNPERCDIYRRIDALDSARTVAELRAALKPILNLLAYDMVAGDSSVSAYQEEWHDQYAAALREEAGSEAPPPTTTSAKEAPRTRAPQQPRPSNARPSNARPPQPAISASLQSILDGSHPSFRD